MNLSHLSKRLDVIENRRYQLVQKHINFLGNTAEIYSIPNNRLYKPSPTAEIFHQDDSFVRLAFGPYGSGKTTMCLQEIVRRASKMPVWSNGRRRMKTIIIRNTSGELHSTTLPSWLSWFGDLGDITKRQKPILTYEHTYNDGDGVIELEIIFLALDREDDLRKLKSLEATMAYINELSEVPQGALAHLVGRVNHRYPGSQMCPEPYWCGIIADTNPPDTDHWIYNQFEGTPVEGYKIFKQPPGLIKDDNGNWIANTACDNYENLSPDYYTKLANGQSEQFIKVFCLGEYGSVGFGKKVYSEYNDDLHSVDMLEAIQGETLHLGWDFGLTPACVVCQFTTRGQLLVLKEYTSQDMGIRSFAESIVIPSIARDFPYCKIGTSFADPAGNARDDIMEELSCIGELNSLGVKTNEARTNDIATRIGSVRYFLNRMVDGKPGFLLSRSGCPVLRRGFTKDYCYKRLSIAGEERYQDKPNKASPSSHPHDGLQYIAMEFAPQSIMKDKGEENHVDMWNPGFRY